MPVVISVDNNEMGHGIFVVGIECDNNDNISKLFCLDPGFGISDTAYWNCVIDASRKNAGTFPYWYITSDIKSKVEISSIISISYKTDED